MSINNYTANGFLLINKPRDFTSFDVVAVVRKLLNIKKVGHTGTLDPFATGVLPIMIGKSTKALQYIKDTDKEYIAEFKLGIKTDTQDITGKIIDNRKVNITAKDISKALKDFSGEILQTPPMYSAVKVNGKKLCDLARQNKEIERKPKKITINKIELVEYNPIEYIGKIFVSASKGTYIRTICNDLGEKLGCGGTTLNLIRTKACSFYLEECITLDQAKYMAQNNTLIEKIILPEKIFSSYEKLNISNQEMKILKNGGTVILNNLVNLNINRYISQCVVRVYNNNIFFALGKINPKENKIKLLKQF